ncbi:MAG: glycosyltransferase family 2 protein [Microbacteriaceae bacterium]|nr:glycosyltransferase family 2 protein [Microbacteriaceae bacterium]
MADKTQPSVGIVTVAYRSGRVLPAFLDSVPGAASGPLRVVVVDNDPSRGDARRLAEASGAGYVPLPSNPGYGGAVNAGVAALPGVEWILVSNPDVVLGEGVVDALLARAETDTGIGAVGPAVHNPDGSVYPSARAVPSLRTGVGHALFANLWQRNPWTQAYRRETDPSDQTRDAGWLSGSCLLVRRSAFDEIGGFDEGYFMYFEDVDLGYRLGKAGYRNVYEPAASVTHTGAHSTGSESARMVAAHHESARRFLSKKYSGWWLWPVRVALRAGLSLRSRAITRRLRRDGAAPL